MHDDDVRRQRTLQQHRHHGQPARHIREGGLATHPWAHEARLEAHPGSLWHAGLGVEHVQSPWAPAGPGRPPLPIA